MKKPIYSLKKKVTI